MFTGIVKKIGSITQLKHSGGLLSFEVDMGAAFMTGLQVGASVAVDGICLTVVKLTQTGAWFDAIAETLQRTTLKKLTKGAAVNLERSACFGDEIGGHILSGHVYGTVKIRKKIELAGQTVLALSCPKDWTNYLFPKGFVALNGASLTLVDVALDESGAYGVFTVHLIPETLRKTTFASKEVGDLVNLELDAHTQAIVDSVERIVTQKYRAADDADSVWRHTAFPTARQTAPWAAAAGQKR